MKSGHRVNIRVPSTLPPSRMHSTSVCPLDVDEDTRLPPVSSLAHARASA